MIYAQMEPKMIQTSNSKVSIDHVHLFVLLWLQMIISDD